ncbi:MAG: type I 3-dehydroquinate dehydratase [Candidatus Peregrinibacteria bacterium]
MFVVTLPSSAVRNPRIFAAKAKRSGADILEIRGDITPDVPGFSSPIPLLIAPRGTGRKLIEKLHPQYVDLEMRELRAKTPLPSGTKLIASFHDYQNTPSLPVLKKRVQLLCSSMPKIVKIATKVIHYKDLLTLEKLQKFLEEQKIPSIVLGMGDKAHLSRLLSVHQNVFTYACLEPRTATAPGQLTLAFHALTRHTKRPRRLGIIGGEQVTRSLSPLIHNTLFHHQNIDALYSCFPSRNFSKAFRTLEKVGITGFSVTAPFKREAFRITSSHDDISKALGTANTLIKTGRGWKSFNTDARGFRAGYPEIQTARSFAILGAGGVVPAIILAIRQSSPTATITVFARDLQKAKAALRHFDIPIHALSAIAHSAADCVICAVSQDVSLHLPKPSGKKPLAIDLRYGKHTQFMQAAHRKWYRVIDGLPMLLQQALAQFELFTGKNILPHHRTCLKNIFSPAPVL